MGCLVASENLAGYAFVGEVSGFDLSAFTAFAPQRLPIHGTMTAWERLSDDLELVRLDDASQPSMGVNAVLRAAADFIVT